MLSWPRAVLRANYSPLLRTLPNAPWIEVFQCIERGNISGTVSLNPLGRAPLPAPAIVSSYACALKNMQGEPSTELQSSLSVWVSPLQDSVLQTVAALVSLDLQQGCLNWGGLLGFAGAPLPCTAAWKLSLSSQYTGVVGGLTVLVFYFSAVTVLHYLMSSVL